MVVVTHDSTVARRAQRIGVMKNGRLTFRQSAGRQSAGRHSATDEKPRASFLPAAEGDGT
jgi:ABC-type lipoprotein export system ATPase subunit